jgi:type VI secretion system protein
MNEIHSYGLFEVFTQEWQDQKPIHLLDTNQAIVQSIQDHLSRLLNARQGALSHLPDYGLPDLIQAYGDLSGAVGHLQAAIVECIKKYEPRIADVTVISLPDDRAKGVIILEIHATLLNGRKTRFETYLKSEGYAKVIQSSSES